MKEVRVAEIRADSPVATEENGFNITGRPIVFDTPTVIHDSVGQYTEIIKRGALDGADLTDVRLLVNHDETKIPLARVPKTMSLSVDGEGLNFRATLPDTENGREAYEAVRRGVLTGMSFAFKVPQGGDTYDVRSNTRTITRIEKVYECSLVNYPAYESTFVSVESRSARQASLAREDAKNKAKILINQIKKVN